MESLEKIRSKFLEEIKQFSKYHDNPEGYWILQVTDDSGTKDEIEIIEYNFEASKISSDQVLTD